MLLRQPALFVRERVGFLKFGDAYDLLDPVPGNSPGLMAYEDGLSLGASSVTEWEFTSAVESYADEFFFEVGHGNDYDAIDINGGTLAIAVGAQLAIVAPEGFAYEDSFWSEQRTFQFVRLGEEGAITGQFRFANNTTQLSLDAGRWNILGSNGADSGVFLQWTPVPEPSTYGLAIGALALASVAVRRRARRPGGAAGKR